MAQSLMGGTGVGVIEIFLEIFLLTSFIKISILGRRKVLSKKKFPKGRG
jgi:K+-transporting ATPase A subunit